jgi:hypothetical protein
MNVRWIKTTVQEVEDGKWVGDIVWETKSNQRFEESWIAGSFEEMVDALPKLIDVTQRFSRNKTA